MKRHALLVGSFVLGALVLIVAAILWLSGNSPFRQEVRAVAYFTGSVNGLYVGAPVTFRGVPVGRVESIGIEVDDNGLEARIPTGITLRGDAVRIGDAAQRERLTLATLVERGLRARLVAQSFVTGQKFIDLDFLPEVQAVYAGPPGAPEIPAVPDRFGALIEQAADLPLRDTVQELRDTLQALQATLGKTQSTLDLTASEVSSTAAQARETLASTAQALQSVQGSARTTLDAVARLADTSSTTLEQVQPQLQGALTDASAAADSARLAMNRLAELSAPGAPLRSDLDAAVRDLSQAARSLRSWAEVLEDRPNAAIFGREPR